MGDVFVYLWISCCFLLCEWLCVSALQCLQKWAPFWVPNLTPDLGPKKCRHTVGGQLFGPKFGTIFGTQNGNHTWSRKQGFSSCFLNHCTNCLVFLGRCLNRVGFMKENIRVHFFVRLRRAFHAELVSRSEIHQDP